MGFWTICLVVWTVVVLAFVHPAAASCPCNATGVLSFNVSVDGPRRRATLKCCPLDGYSTGVGVQRENGSNVLRDVSYISPDGNCDRLTLTLRESYCSYNVVCRSSLTNTNITHTVEVTVGSITSCTNISEAEVDALQYCQCPENTENVTSNYTRISSTLKKVEVTTMEPAIDMSRSNSGYQIPTATVIPVVLVIVLIAVVAIIALVVKMKRVARLSPTVCQAQQETKQLLAVNRTITINGLGQFIISPQIESPSTETDVQRFTEFKEFDSSNESRTPAEGSQTGSVQCTNNPDSIEVAFLTSQAVVQPKVVSTTTAITYIPDIGTSV